MNFDPFSPLALTRGPALPNRFMLAPLTNMQSRPDGTLSDEEFRWLTMRAQGGFGLTMTCAAHVQANGQGFAGQLGIWSDAHIPGLTRLADAIRTAGSRSSVQLHHAGMRSPAELIGETPVCPWDDPETGSRVAPAVYSTQTLRHLELEMVARASRLAAQGGHAVAPALVPEVSEAF